MSRLRVVAAQLRAEVGAFEADRWSGSDCAVLAEVFAATAKACAAAGARAAARAVACHAGDVEWVARTAGTTPAEARAALATTAAVGECPETSDALAAGELSLAQAAQIAGAEQVVPGSEHELLERARSGSFGGLRAAAREVRLGAMDRDELHVEQRRVRSVKHWVDDLGMVAGRFRLSPEVGVAFVNRLDREPDRVRRAARRNGNAEPHDAHAADAFVKAVVTDGVRIELVKHFGRRMPVELRTALELGPPGTLDGAVCADDGCDRRHGLEKDHDDPVANGGMTSYENIKLRCKPDHWAKTERDRTAGLLGGRADERGPP